MKYNVFSISLDAETQTKLTKRLATLGMQRSEYVRSLIRADVAKLKSKKEAQTIVTSN